MSSAIRKRISKKITKALHDFNLIEDGDKVLIAVSGGKDSSVLLMELANRMGKFLPNCEIGAIHIQSDFADKAPREFLQRMAEQYPQIPFYFKDVAVEGRLKEGRQASTATGAARNAAPNSSSSPAKTVSTKLRSATTWTTSWKRF
jgi:Predicted ATPase of the PP-loop superfamily implicated in cell cycle control